MTTQARHRRVTDLFLEICDLPGEARQAALARVRRTDPDIVAEVEALLQHDASPEVDVAAGTVPHGALALAAVASSGAELASGPVEIPGFRVKHELGRGGIGVVFEAEDEASGKRVALKVLQRGNDTQSQRRRFRIEAEALTRLAHPGIAAVLRSSDEGDRPFIAMELVEGDPITAFASARSLGVAERALLVAKLCDAVQHAHDKGFVHRDLKPGNVLVTAEGQPKVLDFGIARPIAPDIPVESAHTLAGRLLGTACYMSPEQMSGDPAAVDTRSDVYSLGVIAYELFSGTLPYGSKSMGWQGMAQALYRDEARPLRERDPSIPETVDAAVMQALAKERAERIATASAFGEALRRAVTPEPAVAPTRPASTPAPGPKANTDPPEPRDNDANEPARPANLAWGIAGLAGTLLVGLVVVTVLLVRAWSTAREQAEHAGALRQEAEAARDEAEAARREAEKKAERTRESGRRAMLLLLEGTEGSPGVMDAEGLDGIAALLDDGVLSKEAPQEAKLRRLLAMGYRGLGREADAAVQAKRADALERRD
jgi:predicted Ser/Thr protein kinase